MISERRSWLLGRRYAAFAAHPCSSFKVSTLYSRPSSLPRARCFERKSAGWPSTRTTPYRVSDCPAHFYAGPSHFHIFELDFTISLIFHNADPFGSIAIVLAGTWLPLG